MLVDSPHRRLTVPLLAVVGVAFTFLSLVGAGPAFAADDPQIGISARPGGADGAPDGRTRFSYTTDPGQQVDDVVVVANSGDSPQHFTIYGTDAFVSPDGEFGLLPTDEDPEMVGSWVRFGDDQPRVEFDLAPGEERVLPFRVAVPPQAPPGDHAGGIVASVVTPGEQVNIDRRVAVRLYTRVSGDIQPMLAISNFQAEHHGEWWDLFGGTVTLRYTVQNTGNIALAANASTDVASWFGIQAAEVEPSTVDEILPGFSREVVQEIPGVGQWGYLAPAVHLNPFVDDTSNPDLQLTVAATSRDTTVLVVPWIVLIAIGLVVVVVLIVRWRRRVAERRADEWAAYQEAQQAITAGAGETAHVG